MADRDPVLDELIEQLIALAAQQHGPDQGLFAAIFVADALRAGGLAPERFKVGTTRVEVRRGQVGPALAAIWERRFGAAEAATLDHHVLLLDDLIIDPVLRHLRYDAPLFTRGPPATFYGTVTAFPIYRLSAASAPPGDVIERSPEGSPP